MSSPTQPLQQAPAPPQVNNPFEGLSGIIPATQIQETKKLKAAILGLPKSGKSWFASTAPGEKLVYDFDDRANSLAGKSNLGC